MGALACFRNTASAGRLRRAEQKLAGTEEQLRRSEQRALCCDERLMQSEEVRRREKARLCKAELDQQRCLEWRRDHEKRSPAAARAVAIAILSASSCGFARGVTTLVLTVWASHTARMKRARAWNAGPSEISSTQLSTPERTSCPDPNAVHKAIDSQTPE